MTSIRVIVTVIAVALLGMILGGGFGWAAGTIAPSLFDRIIPWSEVEPVGGATVIGAFGGVLCGGALGGFAMILQTIAVRRDGPA
jgi:hypothetical protein